MVIIIVFDYCIYDVLLAYVFKYMIEYYPEKFYKLGYVIRQKGYYEQWGDRQERLISIDRVEINKKEIYIQLTISSTLWMENILI